MAFWASKTAERVARQADRLGITGPIVCASGISPSGPVHMGNLREVLTTHIVTQALLRMGREAVHIHSWDDFDRFRRVPDGMPDGFAEHVGRPLADVPDPGGEFSSYAERHEREFEEELAQLGVVPRFIRQHEQYRQGVYTDHVVHCLRNREAICDTIASQQTQNAEETPEAAQSRRLAYYPFQPYCAECGRDSTKVIGFAECSRTLSYVCDCGFKEEYCLDDRIQGKLVWKVDWPMRWAHESVVFEPGGVDHSSPGSSYTVGKQIARSIFSMAPPYYVGYAFVGISGMSKMSGSVGGAPTAGDALELMPPEMVKWLYCRRKPSQPFTVDFGTEVIRLYDEWDRLQETARSGSLAGDNTELLEYCWHGIDRPEDPDCPSFRILASLLDITQLNQKEALRVYAQMFPSRPITETGRTRLSYAMRWIEECVPPADRTLVRETFDDAYYESIPTFFKECLALLLSDLDKHWSEGALLTFAYSVPKILCGLPLAEKPPKDVVQKQKELFRHIYRLTTGKDRGPRIPILLFSIGIGRTRHLLGGESPTEPAEKP